MNSEPISNPESVPPPNDNIAWIIFGAVALLICGALAIEAPGVLVVLVVVATPALIRTVVVSNRKVDSIAPPSALSVVGTFLSSLGIATMVGIASFIAFFTTCFVVCLGALSLGALDGRGSENTILFASVSAGLVPGLVVAFLLFRLLWGRRG